MIQWTVVYAEQAEQDLRDIYEYIAFSLSEPKTAKAQANRIMKVAASLKEMPLRHQLYENEPWHSKGLRVLPVDHFLIFYLPVESDATVALIRILYGGRDIDEHLKTNAIE